jgi:hypothetical protein
LRRTRRKKQQQEQQLPSIFCRRGAFFGTFPTREKQTGKKIK